MRAALSTGSAPVRTYVPARSQVGNAARCRRGRLVPNLSRGPSSNLEDHHVDHHTHPHATSRSVRRAGVWCLGAGLVGAAQAIILLAWSPQVPDDRYSYPFTGLGFVTAQTSFFLQHLPLVLGVAALRWLPGARASRTARIATGAAAVGLMLLAVNELITIAAYHAATDSPLARLVNNLYGPPIILIRASLLVAGIALLRQGTAGWAG